MSTLAYAVRDTRTMLHRDFMHSLRFPVMTLSGVITPVFFLAMFVYVLGGALGTGIGAGDEYINFIAPGILVMAVGTGSATTAVNVNTDMTEGIIARFRTMSISRQSVLTGTAVGAVIRTMLSLVLVTAAAMLMGFDTTANVGEWLAAAGVLALFALALTWVSIGLGLWAKSPGGANGSTMIVQFLLPFLSSAFVPTGSMPSWLRAFAENQPYTHLINTMRGLLQGEPIGDSAVLAVIWCVAIGTIGYLWARKLYNRDPAAS
ncbi:ABC-2 type transport system permease protein [Herbihabitans rhizosphaerae]|uniref:Transport permease protein n=1 Tax=Herbihabitans rhizosphaerae TaxID=1872711 RepID=A0A4V2ERF8_9PSEU|nr:ABC transporter permease [Herbihabitans rhizosphaerae]RZS31163.1 ABC-2 type transport system permease protein [Herbihabitans rhizosphaerae]